MGVYRSALFWSLIRTGVNEGLGVPPLPFSTFIGVLCLFQKFEVALQSILALPSPDLSWCDINGEPLSFVGPTVPPQLPSLANLAQLGFRNQDSFQAGSLHNHVDFWENNISSTGYSCLKVARFRLSEREWKFTISSHILNETLKADAVLLVSAFPNSPCCRRFCDFIDSKVLDWISQGVIKV